MTDTQELRAVLPAYEIGEELGRGAWGVVVGGRHRESGRDVAIKVLPRALGADLDVRRRFVAEARVLSELDHPHVVRLHAFVDREHMCALIMELLPGGSVWDRFAADGFTAPAACAVVVAAGAGLHHAHEQGVLHRDVKPDNLLFAGDGVVKVTDFGLARVIGGESTLATRTGVVLGTPAYIAPEQLRDEQPTRATDVYALGTVLFELLTGDLPFEPAEDLATTLRQRATQRPQQVADLAPEIPESLAAVADRALLWDPASRQPTTRVFAAEVAKAAAGIWGPDWPAETGIPVPGAREVLAPGPKPRTPAAQQKAPAPKPVAPHVESVLSHDSQQYATVDDGLAPDDLVPAHRLAPYHALEPGPAIPIPAFVMGGVGIALLLAALVILVLR